MNLETLTCPECGVRWEEHCSACESGPVKPVDLPLVCRIEGEQLVIRIGIDTLAFATEHCEKFYDYDKHDGPPYVKVVDKNALAHDTVHELLREREDGATPLCFLFDDAAEAALEDGSLAFCDETEVTP
jgi:hypothetical protein